MQPAFFLAGNRARNGVAACRRVQKHVYFNYFIAYGFRDRSAHAVSSKLFVSEERRERERRERHRVRINRRASEEDSSGKFMEHLRLVH